MAEAPALTVLVVDDDEAGRYATARGLRRDGFTVIEAGTGEEGLDLVRKLPDIVVLDILLPDVDGLEVCRRIRADSATRLIPVLHLSATSMSSADRIRGLEGGADAYLVKPVETAELAAVIRALVRGRRAERERAASEDRFRLLVDSAPIAITELDLQERVISWNRTAERLYGWSAAEVLGGALPVVPPDLVEQFHALFGQVAAGESLANVEARWLRRDGTGLDVSLSAAPLIRPDGSVVSVMALTADITEWKRAEAEKERHREARIQSDKLAGMGQLLAGVAHELNNPLSVVLGQSALLRESLAGQPLEGRAEKIAQAAERCARIVKSFLALARQQPMQRVSVALNPVVREAADLLAYPLRVDAVEVVLDLAHDLPRISGDPHQLHQVFVNLIANAHQAMRATPPPRRITLASRHDPGRGVVTATVADTGPGIPPGVRARLFEPFFTTKPPGQGTGLGLSLCRGIVEEHGGTISVESDPGRGARFIIELPVAAAAGIEAPAERGAPPATGASVLVVDDERDIAELLADLLALDGHRVEIETSAEAALERMRERRYDLVLSDMRMPHMDGPAFHRTVRSRDPDLARRFVFVTGDALGPETVDFLRESGAPSFAKPFNIAEVRQAVQRALQAAT